MQSLLSSKFANARPEMLLNFGRAKKVPSILQAESAECGLACLAMVLHHFGFETDLNTLRRRFPISTHGTSLKEIMNMANAFHLIPRALRGEVDSLSHVQLPCILHWGMNHFVVLTEVKRSSFTILDPARGEVIVDRTSFGNEFTGVILELNPSSKFEKRIEKEIIGINQFWSNTRGLKRSIFQILILSLLLQFFNLASPFYMQTVVDDIVLRHDKSLLIALTFGFALLMFINIGTGTLREFVILHLSSRLNIQMSANLFKHLIRLPMDYFTKRHVGDIISRFSSLGQIRNLLTYGLVAAMVDGLMAIITLAAMIFYDVKLTLLVIFVLILYMLLRWAFYTPLRLLTEEKIVAGAKEASHFLESMRGIQTIKLFQRENERQSEWLNRLASTMNKDIRIAKWNAGYSVAHGLLFGIENLLVSYFAASSVIDNTMTIGMLYAFIAYKMSFVGSMNSLINQFIQYKMLGLYMNRLADIAFTPTEISTAETVDASAADESIIEGEIEVRNLSFRYNDAEDFIFKDLNFKIAAGETVVFTGPSGCGKTTLLKCLMGLIDPSEGEILIDGKQLKSIIDFRKQIGAVMQDDQLLTGDIAENIASFSQSIDMERVIHCARLASIHDDIHKMPMRYHTLVGDMGSTLSGGQKQRVILARALYREPKILFLDEATSHLDAENEESVSKNIKTLNVTRAIVAHRAETIKSAGREIKL